MDKQNLAENIGEVLGLLQMGFNSYNVVKQTKMLQTVGKDCLDALKSLSKMQTETDVFAYKQYVKAGMSSAEAVEVIVARNT